MEKRIDLINYHDATIRLANFIAKLPQEFVPVSTVSILSLTGMTTTRLADQDIIRKVTTEQRLHSDGLALGFSVWGPPTQFSWERIPAGSDSFAASILDGTLSVKVNNTNGPKL